MENHRSRFEEFDENGYLVIEDLFKKELIDSLYDAIKVKIQLLFEYIEQHPHQPPFGIGMKNGFKEIVQRQAFRYEIKLTDLPSLTIATTFASSSSFQTSQANSVPLKDLLLQIEENPALHTLVQELFPGANDYQIIHQSCVVSYPGTEEQTWHSDGPHISVTEYLPCHVFNVFIPLIDILEEHGPTEIRPSSHHYTNNLVKGMLLAKLKKQLKSPVKPLIKKGSVLMFDYRVLHRGCKNQSLEMRPILVFTFAKSWYKDNLNFPSRSLFDSTREEAIEEDQSKGECDFS